MYLCSASTQNKINTETKFWVILSLIFSKSVWLQMVWKLKAEFLRRAITHEDRICTESHT